MTPIRLPAWRAVVFGDDERRVDVYLGEMFPIGDQTWRVDEVTMPENRRFTATVTRVW